MTVRLIEKRIGVQEFLEEIRAALRRVSSGRCRCGNG